VNHWGDQLRTQSHTEVAYKFSEILQKIAEIKQKLSAISGDPLNGSSSLSAPSGSRVAADARWVMLSSETAVKFKKQLVYVVPSLTKSVIELQSNQVKTSTKIAKWKLDPMIKDGFGFETGSGDVKSETAMTASVTSDDAIIAEELSSLAWIVSASRAALAHLYSEDGGESIQRSDYASNFVVWKEIVDLKQSLLEREEVIKSIFSDLLVLENCSKLLKLYSSEIGIHLERLSLAESKLAPSEETVDEYFFSHSAQSLLAQESLLGLTRNRTQPNVKETDMTDAGFSDSHIIAQPTIQSNPLCVLLQSVFPMSELRTAADLSASITNKPTTNSENVHVTKSSMASNKKKGIISINNSPLDRGSASLNPFY
jgi:hypothetical protein